MAVIREKRGRIFFGFSANELRKLLNSDSPAPLLGQLLTEASKDPQAIEGIIRAGLADELVKLAQSESPDFRRQVGG